MICAPNIWHVQRGAAIPLHVIEEEEEKAWQELMKNEGVEQQNLLRTKKGRLLASSSQGTRTLRLPAFMKYDVCQNEPDGIIAISGHKIGGVVWKGWGTTLAWFGNFIGGLPENQMNYLMRLLYSRRYGLGFNIARYNIPGGRNRRFTPQYNTSHVGKFYFPPGFQSSRGGAFNWSVDEQQRRVLLKAKELGANIFEAIAYSPPWWATISKDVAGGVNGEPNLDPECVDEYAEYIVRVVKEYRTRWNVTFSGVTPFNEPLERWWKKGGKHEGCAMNATMLESLTAAMRVKLLLNRMPDVKLAGFDSWSFTSEREIAAGRSGAPRLSGIHVHGYRRASAMSPQADREDFEKMSAAVQAEKKSLWQTEWGPLGILGSDMELALLLGMMISQHVNILKVEAWLHWQAIQWPNYGWGLVRVPFRYDVPFQFFVSRQYWVTMHFTRWLMPGSWPMAVREDCANGVVVAFHPRFKYLAITVVNQKNVDKVMAFNISNFIPMRLPANGATKRVNVRFYRTSETESYKLILVSSVDVPGTVRFVAVANSVSTYVLTGITRPKPQSLNKSALAKHQARGPLT